MFDPVRHLREPDGEYRRYLISCDYGTVNPLLHGLWGERMGCSTGWRNSIWTAAGTA